MPAIYNGGKYYGGFPTKTSQLQNDAQFASINDSTQSLLSTLSRDSGLQGHYHGYRGAFWEQDNPPHSGIHR